MQRRERCGDPLSFLKGVSQTSLCPPVQENMAAACSKALPQGEGCVALHPSVFDKEIPY